MIGSYVLPSKKDGSMLDCIQAAASESNHPVILLGDLNVELERKNSYCERQEDTKALVANMGLKNAHKNFKQRGKWKNWTWSQKREGHRIFKCCDYILSEKREDFISFQIKQPRFDSDH